MSNQSSISADIEFIDFDPNRSFRFFTHDYPTQNAQWGYHPEYELHLITKSSGKYFIGDFVGNFTPGNLVLCGPYLPHHWASDFDEDEVIEGRDAVLQFDGKVVSGEVSTLLPEISELKELFRRSYYGIEFDQKLFPQAQELFFKIGSSDGLEALANFYNLMSYLSQAENWNILSSQKYHLKKNQRHSEIINQVIDYVMTHSSEEIKMQDVAKMVNMSEPNFSRFFKKNMGANFSSYVRKVKISKSCKLLLESKMKITAICYESGYNNLSNFNRHFMIEKGVSPSEYRKTIWNELK
ncbi:MAG: AraC family transcriptional regulator [OCS116 cluster bacterium]|nr:AraC family transcriptional regulator [OCS116 cluster bacterium]